MNIISSSAAQVRRVLHRRPLSSHKGDYGHVLILAGSQGLAGAAYLCALGALKAGAGLVTVAGGSDVRSLVNRRLPEAMTLSLPTTRSGTLGPAAFPVLRKYVRRRTITTLAAGPGLTVNPGTQRLLKQMLSLSLPTVLDADGLNNLRPADLRRRPLVLTPHVGEFSRLTGMPRRQVEARRAEVTADLAESLHLVCLLKGHRTIVSDGTRVYRNGTGNPSMASGGMGDVLTGVIAALLGQGLSPLDAARVGAYIHGLAGDIARVSDRGLLASELALSIPRAYRRLGLR